MATFAVRSASVFASVATLPEGRVRGGADLARRLQQRYYQLQCCLRLLGVQLSFLALL